VLYLSIMKTRITLLLILFFLVQFLYAQNDLNVSRQQFIEQMNKAASLPFDSELNPSSLKIKASKNYKKNATTDSSLQKILQTNLRTLVNEISASYKKKYLLPTATASCPDTSFTRLIGITNGWLYLRSVTRLHDGSMLIPILMYDTAILLNPWGRSYGVLVKLSDKGNVIWIRQFEDITPTAISIYYIDKVFEMPNNDIICVGYLNNDGNSSVYQTPVYRLTSNGTLIWKNSLKSTIGIFNSPPGTFSYNVVSAVEGLNGDLLLCGTSNSNISNGHLETVVRLNNLGQVIWDANYGNHGADGSYRFGAEGVKVFLKNGQVILVGLSHGSNNPSTPPAINFFTLDYATGNLVNKRFYKPQYADPWEEFLKSFTYYTHNITILDNGNILFYGKLFSDFVNMTTTKDHFGVVEFDSAFNYVKAYSIQSDIATNYYNNLLNFNTDGKGITNILEYLGSYESNVFFASLNGLQFLHQRKVYYPDAGMPGNNGFAFLNDNGYGYVQTYFKNTGNSKSYFEFRKMHNSDTSSICMGKDTLVFNLAALNIVEDPNYFYWDTNNPNKIQQVVRDISITDTLSSNFVNPCQQINQCDTISIHGNTVVCGSAPTVVFTGFKKQNCGGSIQWNIDKNAIDSFKVLTDTSVRIWFKNSNWQGKLYAYLPASACFTSAIDSLAITVIGLQTLNLGIDTVLCSQNSLVLHAGSTFSSYVWQNGSTDSTFTVTVPGIYYVTVNDLCGNTLTDTISITTANFPFTIGNDTLRCNNDSIRLTATPGFINYNWYNNYNISTTIGSTITVFPAVDTFYYAIAEKWPGCFVRDTIRINVRYSPPIMLGVDTSICTAQTLTLDAGAGFASYVWNTGSIAQQIIVNQIGTYFIKATATNSCVSYDTLRVLNVSPLPVFTLGPDTTICTGKTHSYLFNLATATYLWQDGSTANYYSINQNGQYILKVTQAGCAKIDTVQITTKPTPVLNLGVDTSICSGTTYLLNASYSGANYIWQDGTTLPQYTVKTGGQYRVTSLLNNCSITDTVLISFIPKPTVTLGLDTVICKGQSFTLKPLINTFTNYLWQDGTTVPFFEVTKPGVFILTINNKCGTAVDSIIVTEGLCKLIMPNSFTPNGDGVNDIFRIKYPFATKSFQFLIYNRYGEKIFETNDMRKGWDGTYKSIKQQTGNFIWVIKIEDINSQIQFTNGVVLLIR
jgi:gliding motility-associated-like protein